MSDIRVKICGLRTAESVDVACKAGAAYVGFVFFERSPRAVNADLARDLSVNVPPGVAKVALVVDASNDELDRITGQVPLDMLQLHGSETSQRVREIRARYGLPVMKAVGVANSADLPDLDDHGRVADQLLVDAKPVEGAALPGGNGLSFDWRLVSGRRWAVPWMLAGGLTVGNVSEAIARTGARQVDVSSGVERAPGEKDAELISAFVAAARG